MTKWMIFTVLSAAVWAHATEIKHCFLAKDESRPALHYLNQFDPSQDWTIQLPPKCRDIRLTKNNTVLISHWDGYLEYDLKTQKQLKKVSVAPGGQVESLERLPNGHTIITGRKGCNTFYELEENDELVRKAVFPQYKHLRLFRLTRDGHFLFGGNKTQLLEFDPQGKIVWKRKS